MGDRRQDHSRLQNKLSLHPNLHSDSQSHRDGGGLGVIRPQIIGSRLEQHHQGAEPAVQAEWPVKLP